MACHYWNLYSHRFWNGKCPFQCPSAFWNGMSTPTPFLPHQSPWLLACSPAQFPKPALITACPQHSFARSDSHYPIFVNGNETPLFKNMVSFPFPLDTKLVQRGWLNAALPARGISQREDIRGLSIDKLLELREVSQRSSPVPLSSVLCLPGWPHPLTLNSMTYWRLSNIYIQLKTNISVLCQGWS